MKPEIRCQNVLHSQKLCQSRKAEQQHLTHLKNVSRQNIRCLRILSHTASKQGFYRDCSPGPTDLNPSQVAILAHKHWVGVAFFFILALCFFLSCNNPDKQSICLWPPPWITITHNVVEAEHVGKVRAPDVTAHLFQCSHHYRITDLHLRLSTSFQVVSKTDPIKNWDILGCSSTWFNMYSVSLHRES